MESNLNQQLGEYPSFLNPGCFSPSMPAWQEPYVTHCCHTEHPQDSPSSPCFLRAHIVLCFHLVKFYEIPALGSFTSTAIIISQDSTHYKDPEELDDPALPVRTWTFRHSHIFLPENLDQDKKEPEYVGNYFSSNTPGPVIGVKDCSDLSCFWFLPAQKEELCHL